MYIHRAKEITERSPPAVARNRKSLVFVGQGHESWSKGCAGISDRAPEIRFASHYYGRAVVRNKYVWIFGTQPHAAPIRRRAFVFGSQDGTHRSSRGRRFRCETTGNARCRIPWGRITRALRANVMRTRFDERYTMRGEMEFSPTHLSPSGPSASSSDASAWRMVIVLDRYIPTVRPDEPERIPDVSARITASRNAIYSGNLYRDEHRYIRFLDQALLSFYSASRAVCVIGYDSR